jgi:hypothetical protein
MQPLRLPFNFNIILKHSQIKHKTSDYTKRHDTVSVGADTIKDTPIKPSASSIGSYSEFPYVDKTH